MRKCFCRAGLEMQVGRESWSLKPLFYTAAPVWAVTVAASTRKGATGPTAPWWPITAHRTPTTVVTSRAWNMWSFPRVGLTLSWIAASGQVGLARHEASLSTSCSECCSPTTFWADVSIQSLKSYVPPSQQKWVSIRGAPQCSKHMTMLALRRYPT